jgi:TctA family transporter
VTMRWHRHVPAAAAAVLAVALPAAAFAQTSSSTGDAAAGAAVTGIFALWSVFFLVFYAVFWLLFILVFVLWIMAIIDVISRRDGEFPNGLQGHPGANDKMLWVLVVLLAGVIGAVVYYFSVMKPFPLKRIRPPMVPPEAQPQSYQQTAPPQQPQQAQAEPPQPQPPSLHGRPGA